MTQCQRCAKQRITSVCAKCGDMCSLVMGDIQSNNYVPNNMNIGGGDYVQFEYCLDCGQIQGSFPLNKTPIEEQICSVEEMRKNGSKVFYDLDGKPSEVKPLDPNLLNDLFKNL